MKTIEQYLCESLTEDDFTRVLSAVIKISEKYPVNTQQYEQSMSCLSALRSYINKKTNQLDLSKTQILFLLSELTK